MRQTRPGQRLPARPGAVGAGLELYPLDRHLAVKQPVVGAPDDPEAARAKSLAQAVASEHVLLELGAGRAGRPAGVDESR